MRQAALTDPDPAHLAAPGQLAFALQDLHGAQPLWLHFAHTVWLGSTVRFGLRSEAQWLRGANAWLAWTTAALTVLLIGALMGLWFGLLLRDRAYLLYALYVLAYALYAAVGSGYVFHPLAWDWMGAQPALFARVAAGLAGLASVLFARRFADLSRLLPWSRWPLRVLVALFAVIVLLSLLPVPVLRTLAADLQNPVVLLAASSMLVMLLLAVLRGGRYAAFMLLGWTPLVVLSAADSLQAFGLLLHWTWLQQATLGAAAFEALVLIAGLADRTLWARRDHRQAIERAELDALTGVLNRGALLQRLRQWLDAGSAPLSVLFVDLDHFKRLNDEAGHQAGDQALQSLVRLLRLELREGDVLGRYGGEEFMVLLPGQGLSQALAVAERLLASTRRRRLAIRPDLAPLTVSIGAAEWHPHETHAQLLERADQAMYAAKRNGRDQVQAAGAPAG